MTENEALDQDQIKAGITSDVIAMVGKISEAMGNKYIKITEETKFFGDLGFPNTLLKEFWKPLTRISNKYSGTRVTKSEAGRIETVADAIKLIISKIAD